MAEYNSTGSVAGLGDLVGPRGVRCRRIAIPATLEEHERAETLLKLHERFANGAGARIDDAELVLGEWSAFVAELARDGWESRDYAGWAWSPWWRWQSVRAWCDVRAHLREVRRRLRTDKARPTIPTTKRRPKTVSMYDEQVKLVDALVMGATLDQIGARIVLGRLADDPGRWRIGAQFADDYGTWCGAIWLGINSIADTWLQSEAIELALRLQQEARERLAWDRAGRVVLVIEGQPLPAAIIV